MVNSVPTRSPAADEDDDIQDDSQGEEDWSVLPRTPGRQTVRSGVLRRMLVFSEAPTITRRKSSVKVATGTMPEHPMNKHEHIHFSVDEDIPSDVVPINIVSWEPSQAISDRRKQVKELPQTPSTPVAGRADVAGPGLHVAHNNSLHHPRASRLGVLTAGNKATKGIDYSVYKGRGRYASKKESSINAEFQIDPDVNGGKTFQYHEVVRGRERRRHLEGEDCECCRDYYDLVGPMPNRLQPPLWRSPPPDDVADPKTAHKQAISRHRHRWSRGTTPPSFWVIGFPDAQQVQAINEKAEIMHREKRKRIEAEANGKSKQNRYKRRKS